MSGQNIDNKLLIEPVYIFIQSDNSLIINLSLHITQMSPAPPLSGVKCLLLLVVLVVVMTSSSHCLSSNTTIHYYVHPDNSSTHLCPPLSTCLTINEYAPIINNAEFLQNAEIVLTFLPGEHVLSDSDIQLSHIDSFTMTSRDGNAVTSLVIRESRIEIYGINAVSINQLSLTVIQSIILSTSS